MIAFHPQLFVRIEELNTPRAPQPRPLENGFTADRLYRVLGVANASESSDAFFILANDRDEMWFICQRHLRFGALKDTTAHHLPYLHAQAAD